MRGFRVSIKGVLIFVFISLVMILFFEIYFRTTEIILPSYVYDDEILGRTHKAGTLVNLVGAEGFYIGEINRFGYPGKEYPPLRYNNSLRIALIGDSYVEGFQLFERLHFARLMEKELSQELNKPVEVLNFGTGGADFRGMYLRYIKLAKNFNPDITLFFLKQEDLVKKDAIPMPDAVLSKDSVIYKWNYTINSSTNLRMRFAFVRNFSVGNLFKEVFEVLYTGRFNKIVFEKINTLFDNKDRTDASQKENEDNFYEINKRIIELIKKEDSKYSKRVIIVEVEDLPSTYISIFRENGIPLIKLNEELKKYSDYELKYWKASGKFGHWNQKTHKIISSYLFNKLSSIL